MTKNKINKTLIVIVSFILLLPTVNVINENEIISIIIESFIIVIGAFTLIINTRDLEKSSIKMTIKNKHYENYDTTQMKKFEKNIKFSEMTDRKAMVLGIIAALIFYVFIIYILEKYIIKDEVTAGMWGDYLGDSLTFIVFAILIFQYIIKDEEVKDDKVDEKKTYKNETKRRSNMTILISIIKSIFNRLLGGSVIYSSSKAAKLIGIKTETLIKYSLLLESNGYEIAHNNKRHRYYCEKDIMRIRAIITKTNNGIALEEAVISVVKLRNHNNESNGIDNDQTPNNSDIQQLKEIINKQSELIISLTQKINKQHEYISKQTDIKLSQAHEQDKV